MSIPVIATLHVGSAELLETAEDIVAYVIRHSLNNPGSTSSTMEDEIISFRKLEAQYGTVKENLANQYAARLRTALNHYFIDQQIAVDVTAYEISVGKYGLSIAVTTADGTPILQRGTVEVSDNSLVLTL